MWYIVYRERNNKNYYKLNIATYFLNGIHIEVKYTLNKHANTRL